MIIYNNKILSHKNLYNFLYKEYIINHKSLSQIGKMINKDSKTVSYHLKKLNIRLRNKKEASKYNTGIFKKGYKSPFKGKTFEQLFGKIIADKLKTNLSFNASKKIGYLNPNFGNHKLAGKNNPMFGKKGKESPSYIDGRKNRKYFCIDCGCPISVISGFYGKGRCKSCSKKELYKNYPELNPLYVHGNSKSLYPSEFNKELKNKIKKRDKFICQHCGKTEEENVKKTKKCLTVHHIDYNKNNCNENNLITLCANCHIKTNTNRDYWYAYFVYIIEHFKG